MGISERNEWLQDCIIELFSEISGLYGGVEGDTVVYTKNSARLFTRACNRLKCKASYQTGLLTIDDFVHHFEKILDDKLAFKKAFLEEIQNCAKKFSGYEYAPDAIVFGSFMPTSSDPVQYQRESISYELKLGGFKNFLRNKYDYFRESEAFYKAKTIKTLADVLFYARYCSIKNLHCK